MNVWRTADITISSILPREMSVEPWKPIVPFFLNEARADVRSHDDDRVLEIDGVAQRIRQNAVLKNLQQDIENVRMRLFDLVKQAGPNKARV